MKVIYSAVFVDKPKILKRFTPVFDNVHAHHMTIEFRPRSIDNLAIDSKYKLKIIGRLITDKVDVLLIDDKGISQNEFPHITISTADGVSPVESNTEIKNHYSNITKLRGEISGKIGIFSV